ncbi:MAG: ATP-dependent RecD-like DNA helicase [Thermoanaerobaculia bacterium]|nr:ATP-dependent RecD-like DNA helicase [Thermoanaerobaculia bacterium]
MERVAFHNPDTGFAVLRARVRDQSQPVTVVGLTPSVAPGEHFQASGNWEDDATHGRQFRARHLQITPPSSRDGMERYLASGLIKGIGPAIAKRLVQAFGDEVFDVIEKYPHRLQQVEGIGPTRIRRIKAAWADQKVVREIMVFLQSHGVSASRALRIFRTYGADALPLVTENPYRLARDITGIGFRTADEIAAKLGMDPDSPLRARAALAWVLAEATSQGHCALPRRELLDRCEELLSISPHVLETALADELAGGELVADTVDGEPCVFLQPLWAAERLVASRLAALGRGEPPWRAVAPDRALPWVEGQLGIHLAASQRAALSRLLATKVGVLTGGPGVGKTTLIKALLYVLLAREVWPALCAPTGRAAKRLAESTGVEAKTIHRLLEAGRGGFKRNADHPLECGILIVDETSMVDVPLLADLLAAVPDDAAVLLVGDADQLPPVGPGQALADVMGCGAFPVAELKEIFRQEESSRIVANAHRVNRGEMPALEPATGDAPGDFFFVDAADPEDCVDKIVRMIRDRIPSRFGLDPLRDVQVLCPMNRGPLGAQTLNQRLQQVLNPAPGTAGVTRFGQTFRPGDKVMQTENDYDKEVFNGDVGFVESLDAEAGEAVLRFDGRRINYAFGELDRVSLAYAITIHKSQGSEYPAIVVPLTTGHYPMLQRNLLYTAITRGRRLVVLVGERRALAIAVRGQRSPRRWSKLRERLEEATRNFSG